MTSRLSLRSVPGLDHLPEPCAGISLAMSTLAILAIIIGAALFLAVAGLWGAALARRALRDPRDKDGWPLDPPRSRRR